MLGSARLGRAVSRALGDLYGGRVSCHVSIMYGAHSSCPARVSWARLVGWLAGRSVSRMFGGSVCPPYTMLVWMCNGRVVVNQQQQ